MKRLLVLGRKTNTYTKYFLQQPHVTFDYLEDIEREGIAPYVARRVHDNFDGVLGITELAVAIANVIATASGCNAPSGQAVLNCQNKYISRLAQQRCVPHNTPMFALLHEAFTYPVFVKPARGSLSAFAQIIENNQELEQHIANNAANIISDNKLYEQVLALGHFKHKHLETYKDFLCEALVHGTQVCVDGYVFNGKMHIFGATQAQLLEGTLSFARWDFPTQIDGLSQLVQQLITGIGLDNVSFNVELMVNAKNIYVIEVHARPSTQFAWHIQQVTGQNPLQAACMIALGQQPMTPKKKAVSAIATCFVMRNLHDALVTRVPTQSEVEAIERTYPNVEVVVLVEAGTTLSDYRQDSDTFRYCLINAAGGSMQELESVREEVEKQLCFVLVD